MQRTIVLNPKGGCGKTTIATNLAAFYAQRYSTALLDYDPQASSARWLERRSFDRPAIESVRAYERHVPNVTRAWLTHNPELERVVLDAPAGIGGHHLLELVKRVDTILIPVQPSPIDIQAAADFIRDLLLEGKVRSLDVRIGVIANRVRTNTRMYQALQRFLSSLRLPFLTSLRDTQNYVKAADQGIGIHEMTDRGIEADIRQWEPLVRWLEHRDSGNVTQLRPSHSPVYHSVGR